MVDANTWKPLANRIIDAGLSIFAESEIPITSDGAADLKVLSMTLLARTISNAKAALLLVDANKVVEARILVRCCFENQFWIAGLAKDGQQFRKSMLASEMKKRVSRGTLLFEVGAQMEDEVENRLRAWLRENKNWKSGKTISPKEVATGSVVRKSYVFYEQLSSDSAHPTLDALNRYIVPADKDGIRGIDINPVVQGVELSETMHLLCLATIGVLAGVNELLGGVKTGDSIGRLADEYMAHMEKQKPSAPHAQSE